VQRVSWRDDFAGAILFGSRARHSHHAESDADVAVLLAGAPGEYVRTKLELDDLSPTKFCSRREITIRLDRESNEYFKRISEQVGIPY
jgi:predicted nucleotidyltransferase